MKKQKNMRRNKNVLILKEKVGGITLIALIITIIVMLILVAVSIQIALNTGLFDSAGKATQNWQAAQESETTLNGITVDGQTVDEYISTIGQEIPWIYYKNNDGTIDIWGIDLTRISIYYR